MSSPQGLADLILPARGAAQRANASFAEQLTESAGRSDSESSPSNSNIFREPNYRAKSVKYRYSATGKHLSSPLKGSPSSPDRKPGESKRPKLATFTPAPSSHALKGKAPALSRKRKASSSPPREAVIPSGFLSSPSPLSTPPSSPITSTKDLPALAVKEPIPGPRKQLTASKTLPPQAFVSKLDTLSQPLSPKRKQKKNKANVKKDDPDTWHIGNSVWVRVNPSGVLVDNAPQLQSDPQMSGQLMWWPAQVVQLHPLRVSLFGDFPSSSSSSRGLCTIFAPSSSNIQSIHDDSGAKRFSCTTFSSSADNDPCPPTKKVRLEEDTSIEAKWNSAVQSMEKASTLEKEGLPALLSSYAAAGGSFYDSLDDSDTDNTTDRRRPRLSLHQPAASARKKPKLTDSTRKPKLQRSRANLKQDTDRSVPRDSPCPPDPTLQIPGELILAMAPKTGASYWPAQILEHVPDRKEKYKVKFLDDEEHIIPRTKFWTSEEEGFVLCTLGEWESAVKTLDDVESEDESGENGLDNYEDPNDTTFALPSLPSAGDFEDLPARAQLAYVKPVLRAILKKEYAPAKEKHEAFMKGGSGRTALLKSAGVRGGMDARFVKATQKAICEWVLGDGLAKPAGSDIVNGTAVGGPTVENTSPEAQIKSSPDDPVKEDKMEGIESTVEPTNIATEDATMSVTLPPAEPGKQTEDSQMVVDGQGEQPVPLSGPANDVALSPAIKQASLAPKSQLDLLAEVSQAVATEPSLLPSHPELPKLNVDLLDIPRKDVSSLPSPLTPVPDEEQQRTVILPRRSSPATCEEFEILSSMEKLDYCLNILLPETIQQLLLWRSGERTSSVLLSPEEEQRLHDVGARKAAETDWVDDVMRLRAAQARLRGIDPNKKLEQKSAEVAQSSGKRSRPRRGTVSRP